MSHLAFLVICFVWGGSFILMERATHAFGPVGVAVGRLAGGAAVLAVVCWVQGVRARARGGRKRGQVHFAPRTPQNEPVPWRDVLRIAGVALVGSSWPFVVQPYCMAHGFGHSFIGMMAALVPLATIVVSVPMLGVWPTGRQLVGVLGGFACMMLLMQDGAERGFAPGLLALAASVPVSYALGNTYLKWKLAHVHSVPLTTLVLGLAAAWLVPLFAVPSLLERLGLVGPAEPTDWWMALAALAVLGAVGTGVAVLLFIDLVVKEGPLFAGMVTYVVPVLALMWGAIDGETITGQQLAAMAGVLAMVALVQFGGRRAAKAVQPDAEETHAEEEPHFCPSENPADAPVGEANEPE